jgi:hypothetical protein
MTKWNERELSYEEAHDWLRSIFHRTRLNDYIQVPSNVVYAILYTEKKGIKLEDILKILKDELQ